MKINELRVFKNAEPCLKITFLESNLIFSDDNSTGKTSLIRFVLYSLLFKISSTQNINMMEYDTELELEDPEGFFTVTRSGRIASFQKGKSKVTKNIDDDNARRDLQARIFGIDSKTLLNNLLGCFFIDQDVGWSMANRGAVTASYNEFEVVDLILSFLDEDELTSIDNKITTLNRETKKYEAIKSLANTEIEDITDENVTPVDADLEVLIEEKAKLSANLASKKQNLRIIEESYKNNKAFIKAITDSKILVKYQQNKFVLKEDNIVDSDVDIGMSKAAVHEQKMHIRELENRIKDLDIQIQSKESELVSVEDLSTQVIRKIKRSNIISLTTLETIINKNNNEKSQLETKKRDIAQSDNEIHDKLKENILFMARAVGVENNYLSKIDKIVKFRNLSIWSGAVLSKAVICYRYAYIKLIESELGINLPMIIDSPGASELTEENSLLIISKLSANLKGHQFIVSTIHKKIKDNMHFDKVMKVEGQLFNKKEY